MVAEGQYVGLTFLFSSYLVKHLIQTLEYERYTIKVVHKSFKISKSNNSILTNHGISPFVLINYCGNYLVDGERNITQHDKDYLPCNTETKSPFQKESYDKS